MDIRILITMDMEPLRRRPEWTGPQTLEESERAASAYHDLAAAHGFPLSCFAHPEIAGPHREMLLEWAATGGTIGLHLHPPKFRYPRYDREFGAYDAEVQRCMVKEARSEWEDALARSCDYFRPGAFSANDNTFPVLAGLGFKGGSVSIPERVWPQRYCVWSGATPDPHRAHAAFRQVAGKLPFVNVPLSVDLGSLRQASGYRYCLDLRPTLSEPPVTEILNAIVRGIVRRNPPVPVIQVVAHNDQPFWDPDSTPGRRLRELLAGMAPACAAADATAVGASMQEVCEQVSSLPTVEAPVWEEDNDVR